MEESEGEELASIPGVRIWGPVSGAQALRAGALAAASSVLIAPQVAPAQLYQRHDQRLTALVPDEVLPKVGDHCAHTAPAPRHLSLPPPVSRLSEGARQGWPLHRAELHSVSTTAACAMGDAHGARAHGRGRRPCCAVPLLPALLHEVAAATRGRGDAAGH